jgi:hypothetical protein
MARYAPQSRPPSSFSLPTPDWDLVERGVYHLVPLRTDLPLGQHPYGVIETPRPISREDCEHFGLKKVD